MSKGNKKIVFTILNLYVNVLKAIKNGVTTVHFHDYIRGKKDHIDIKSSTVSRVLRKFDQNKLSHLIKASSVINKEIISGSRSVSHDMYPTLISIAYQYIYTVGKKLPDKPYNDVVAYIKKLEKRCKRQKARNNLKKRVLGYIRSVKERGKGRKGKSRKKRRKPKKLVKIEKVIMWALISILVIVIFLNMIGITFVSLLMLCAIIIIMIVLVILTQIRDIGSH